MNEQNSSDGFPPGVVALADALARRTLSAREATDAYLARIERDNPRLNAFLHIDAAGARAAADASDARRRLGDALGTLDGIPIGIKDNIDVADLPTTAGIGHFRNHIATGDAFVTTALRAAGAVILGKLNMHEAALGATNDNPWFGRCENPLREGYTPGGSSGGSGAAVAAGLCAAALGSDTLGSVRIPAAYCGTAGLKPTYGWISTRGVVPMSWTFDHVGVLAPRMADCAAMLDHCGGFDAGWPHARARPTRPIDAPLLATMRIGRARGLPALAAGLNDAYDGAIEQLRRRGATIVDVDFDRYEWTKVRRESLLLSEVEAAAHFAEALQHDPDGFSSALREMLAFGAKQSGPRTTESYRRLAATRALLWQVWGDLDALLLPTAPQTAFRFGDPVPIDQADLTSIANILGTPAACVPYGHAADGLPFSMQALARPFEDATAMIIAQALEA